MRGIRTLSATLVVIAGMTTTTSTALGAEAPQPLAAKAKGKVKVFTDGQKAIRKKKGVRVKVKVKKPGKLKVKAKSKTFDVPKFKRLGKPRKANASGTGRQKLVVKLNKAGLRDVQQCESRKIEVIVGGAKGKFKLDRDTSKCKPRKVDLSDAKNCDFIADGAGNECLVPFPDDFHTTSDPDSETGRMVDFKDASMPENSSGVAIAAAPYNGNDGFSPGQTTVVKVPGLDTPGAYDETAPVPLNELSEYDDKRAPIVVINAKTGERQPIWTELDANATSPESTSLLIHPAVNYDSGGRYIVALRNLEDADGDELAAPEGFRYYRDDLPSNKKPIDQQRKRFKKVFKDLRDAKIDRADLYLAWDFTVASDENIAERMLAIRDNAFGQLGDANLADVQVQGGSPGFNVTSVQNLTPAEDAEMARRVQGTFEVPCYLVPSCEPGGQFALGQDGLPSQNGTFTAQFNCMIPRVAVSGAPPARPQLYGHGLLGSRNEATSTPQQLIGNTHNFVVCATDTIGFSNGDVPNIASNILPQLGNFPQLTDRVQQGMLNQLFLGRLMIHPQGFAGANAFRVDDANPASPSTIDASRLYYNGNSQGGILGGSLTAIAPDFTRASLGVPAMNYSVLLNRSIDFDTYKAILDPAYPDPMTQQVALSLIQMLWDRSEANGYAHRMTDRPLPNTPAHEVLMNVAFGDHQVTTWQADVEARTIGASLHLPVVYEGRWPGVEVGWGIDPIESYPFTDSAIVYWDSGPLRPNPVDPAEQIGTDPPPVPNIPNRTGEDPHGDPRVAPGEMQMVSTFLQPDAQSHITDTCNGAPCYAGGFAGP